MFQFWKFNVVLGWIEDSKLDIRHIMMIENTQAMMKCLAKNILLYALVLLFRH
jgi:hypothetical protein